MAQNLLQYIRNHNGYLTMQHHVQVAKTKQKTQRLHYQKGD